MKSIYKGITIATTAACVLLTSSLTVAAETQAAKPVKCYGINSCRGKAQCGAKNKNACAGQNSCKGKGWLYLKSAEECKKRGGEVLK